VNNLEIKTARSVPELESLREAWLTWDGHRDSDIDMVLNVLDSYPEAKRPHVIALYKDGELDAILIGRLDERVYHFKVGYLSVFRPRARCLTFVYGAIRGNASEENVEIFVEEVLKSLKAGEADMALMEFVPVESALYQFSLKMPGFLSRDVRPPLQKHDVMQIPGNIDEVYRRMSSDRRIELRRKVRKLDKHPAGLAKIVCYRNESDLDQLFRDAEEVAKKTYQRGLGVGFVDTPVVRKRLQLGARKAWLRAYILYIGNQPVAFWVGMLYHGTFVAEYMGYDRAYRSYSPGMVLMMRMIGCFCGGATGDDVRELDFGLGHAEYKAVLCTKVWSEAAVFIFSPTPKGVLLKLERLLTRTGDGLARRALSSVKFFDKLKRLWRDRLARRAAASAGSSSPDGTLAPTDSN